MSHESTIVTTEHFAYLAARTQAEDPFVAELKAAAREAGLPPIWVAPEQASLLEVLVKLAGAREVVEVGTLAGSTAIHLARAVGPQGRVRTIEFEPKHAAFARDWCGRSDVADRIEVLEGTGDEHLASTDASSIVDGVSLS